MNETTPTTDTDTFLLVLNDPEFVRVGALLGLRARATHQADSHLVDSFIDSDVQFGVTRHLIGDFALHDGNAPAPDVKGPWYSLDHNFVMESGDSKLPRAPITGKAQGERPKIPHLA